MSAPQASASAAPPQRLSAPHREAFKTFVEISTRWGDNDIYGHVNNAVYLAYFDTAVNQHLIEQGLLDLTNSAVVGLVVENQCVFFSSVAFPDRLSVGLRVAHLGRSSVRYEIAIFRNAQPTASAFGRFVHVYVDRASQRPVDLPEALRTALGGLQVLDSQGGG